MHLDFDDLVAAANMGLVNAATRFDPSQGTKFEAFAEPRIRGAILDSIRSQDTLSRDMRQLNKYLTQKARDLSQALGHFPDSQELAASMGVSSTKLDRLRVKSQAGNHVMGYEDALFHDGQGNGPSFLDVVADPRAVNALDELTHREILDDLTDAITELPQQMQQALSLYYTHDLKLKEVAQVMGFTESRACQIVAAATRLLRDMYSKHPGEA